MKLLYRNKTIKIALLVLMTMPTFTNAQVRPDIYSFSAADRDTLANLMMQYITTSVIEDHCVHQMIAGGHIHSDFDFLPFHRMYIERMEDFLFLQGYPQFVPLPTWNPDTVTPQEFQVIDQDCGSANCDSQHPASTCSTGTTDWNPGILLPAYLSLPIQSGNFNDICDWNMYPDTVSPDGCCSVGLSVTIEGDGNDSLIANGLEQYYHNSVHVIMGRSNDFNQNNDAVMGNFRSPAAPIFWLWHAYVDDLWKSWEENCSQSTTQPVDLYMKDNHKVVPSERDRGEEPNIDNGPLWVSKDIWCRNQPDGFTNQTHQNPNADGINPVYVYVRVRNRGYQTSVGSGTEKLELYWAKAGTALTWPNSWNGSITTPALMGDSVGQLNIPQISAQDQGILQFTWIPPDPSDYDSLPGINDPHHFCLLARIEASNDTMFNEQWTGMWNLGANVKNNNNIVWKNVTLVDVDGPNMIVGGNVFVGNPTETDQTFEFEFTLPAVYEGTPLIEEAEVTVGLGEIVWQKWIQGGSVGQNIKVLEGEEIHRLLITGNPATLKNLSFGAQEQGLINVGFNFLSEEMPYQTEYEYHVIQKLEGGQVIGGETYRIHSTERETGFLADAGPDKEISLGEEAELNATDIGEEAIYNWYSPEGDLIYTGKDLIVSPEITKIYKLEVIAELDGVKDYDEAQVKVKLFEILGISPNPAYNQVTVEYKAENATSAYLIIMQPYGSVYNQYILDVQQSETTINLSGYLTGAYSVILVCNGQAVDSKTLVVQ